MLLVLGACGSSDETVADFDGDCASLDGPGALVAVEIETGALLWSRTIGDATGVAQSDGFVVGVGSSGAGFGVAVTTGELLWCRDFGRVDQNDGAIVLPGFGALEGVAATAVVGGDVIGLDPMSGQEVWRTPVGVLEGLRVEEGNDMFAVLDHNAADSHRFDLDPTTGQKSEPGSDLEVDSDLRLVVDQPYVEGQQVIDIAVEMAGERSWQQRLPGFVAALHGELVVVIDQTGGTGVFAGSADTRVSAYETSTGELRWQVPLPGTPHLTIGAGSLVVVPTGTTLVAIDAADGAIVWQNDSGSPGRGGSYSEPGTFRFLELDELDDDSAGILLGVIVAERKYRD